jgi:hypothetical protein
MDASLKLRRKLTFEAHGRKVVFIKKPVEHLRHVLMKAFLWAMYLPDYPNLRIEVPAGSRYKPDLVAADENSRPVFWGEAGKVSARKMRTLVARYGRTHFAFAKWDARLAPYEKIIRRVMISPARSAPVDLISFPADSAERFIDPAGRIRLSLADVTWRRYPAD